MSKQKRFFLLFYGFIRDFLECPSVKSSNIFEAHRILRNANVKHKKRRVCAGSFFEFSKFISLTAEKKKRKKLVV